MHKKNGRKESGTSAQSSVLSLEARVRKFSQVNGRREVLGFADLVIGGAFVIKGLSIIRTKEEGSEAWGKPFVTFPQKKGTGENAEKYFELAHPVTAEARTLANAAVLKAYEEVSEKATA